MVIINVGKITLLIQIHHFKHFFRGVIPNQFKRDRDNDNQLVFAMFLILIELKLIGNY